MIEGRLDYDMQQDRYLITDATGDVLHMGLHCGECFQVLLPDGWLDARIEYGFNDAQRVRVHETSPGKGTFRMCTSDQWYLVGMPYTGRQLQGLFVRHGV